MTDLHGEVELFTLIRNNQGKRVDKTIIRNLYDKWAPTYDKDSSDLQLGGPSKSGALVRDLYQEKDISILDCGAGTGLVGTQLQRYGFTNIVAQDMSPKILEAAKQKGIYRRVVCAEVGKEEMPFEDNEFDVLVCNGCIIPFHISPNCFPQWIRIVKPGGHIVVVLRRCYVELVEEEKCYYSPSLAESFEANIRNLENCKKWEVISKEVFPGYLVEKEQANEGIALVCKVL
ncbi:Methyltransferase-like protein 27 [Holothuria leucospilota]|uniref:Methyltransferase-like protein 27 n=1 Tax=Holothuria leucospilota TaxID=206669 RepID=A0A9Q1CTZ0_HOLLE|nr:Methyltransferase-like protein 27 [Holothuria leucospilota]